MGFDWSVGVCVEYAQEIEIDVLPTLSRFATRCLMFFDDRGATESRKKVKLPGEVLTGSTKTHYILGHGGRRLSNRLHYILDTEDEVEAMDATEESSTGK